MRLSKTKEGRQVRLLSVRLFLATLAGGSGLETATITVLSVSDTMPGLPSLTGKTRARSNPRGRFTSACPRGVPALDGCRTGGAFLFKSRS